MADKPRLISNIYCNALCVYLVCLPFGAVTTAFGSVLKILALLPIGAYVLQIKDSRKLFMSRKVLYYALFCFWMLLTLPFTISFRDSLDGIVGHFSFLLLLITASSYSYTDKQIGQIKKSLIWASRFTAVLALTASAYEEGRLVLSGFFNEDPNYLCAYFLYGVVYGVETLRDKKKTVGQKMLSTAELLVYSYIILSTGSRGGALAVVAAVAAAALAHRKISGARIVRDLVFLGLLVAIIAVAGRYIPRYIRYRFALSSIRASGGTGRYQLWRWAWKIFSESPIWRKIVGFGTFTIQAVYVNYGYYRQVAHNVFLQFLVENGIVGVLFYTASVRFFVKDALVKDEHFYFAILAGMIVMSLSMSVVVFKPYWNIMLAIVCLNNRTGCPDAEEIGPGQPCGLEN